MSALRVSADDYRLSLQLRVKRLLHRNEEGIQINIKNTVSHETVYKLANRADKANFSAKSAPTILTIVQSNRLNGRQTTNDLVAKCQNGISFGVVEYY